MASDGGNSAFGVVAAALVALGEGEPIAVRIEFEAPPGCSDASRFLSGITSRSERVREAATNEPALELRVRLTRAGPNVHGELRMIEAAAATDTREVDGASCDEVVDALALTAALALDPAARLSPEPAESSQPEPAPSSPPPETPAKVEPPPPPPEVEPPSSVRSTTAFGAELALARVVTPGVSVGGAISARLAFDTGGTWSPAFGVFGYHLRNDFFEPPEPATVALTAFGLEACPLRWRPSPSATLRPCGLLLAGWLSARGRDVSNPESAGRSWWSTGGLFRLAVTTSPGFAVELAAGASAPLVERRFVLGEPESVLVAKTPPLSVQLALGFVAEL